MIKELKSIERDKVLTFETIKSKANHMHNHICTVTKINPNKVFRNKTAITVYVVSIHALSHTLTTRLVENNVHIKYISNLLRHNNIITPVLSIVIYKIEELV